MFERRDRLDVLQRLGDDIAAALGQDALAEGHLPQRSLARLDAHCPLPDAARRGEVRRCHAPAGMGAGGGGGAALRLASAAGGGGGGAFAAPGCGAGGGGGAAFGAAAAQGEAIGAPAEQGAAAGAGAPTGARRGRRAGRCCHDRCGRRRRRHRMGRVVGSDGCRAGGQRRSEEKRIAGACRHLLPNPSRPKKGRSQTPSAEPAKAAANHSQACTLPDAMPLKSAPMLQPKESRAP